MVFDEFSVFTCDQVSINLFILLQLNITRSFSPLLTYAGTNKIYDQKNGYVNLPDLILSQLAVGDPACDLAIAWTFFKDENREAFRSTLSLDEDTWARGRGWALWKALITAAGFTNPNNFEAIKCLTIINEIITEYKN